MPNPISATGTTHAILNKLRVVQAQDAVVEQKLRTFKIVMIISWVGVGVSLFILPGVLQSAALIFAALFLGVAIYATTYYVIYNKQDVENRRITIPLRFFEVLGRDIPAKRRCFLHVDCNGYLKHGVRTQQNATGGFFASPVRQSVYKDLWFVAKGTLCDNTLFRVTIEQSVHRKEKPKRKYTKVSERISEKVTLRLRIAPDAYPGWSRLAATLQPQGNGQFDISRIVVKDSTVLVTAVTTPMRRVNGRAGSQVFGGDTLVTADMLLQLFLFVYSRLGQCRSQQAPSR